MLNPATSRTPLKVYAAKNKDEDIKRDSSSGGIFYELARVVIEGGGSVAGAVLTANNKVEHRIAETIETIRPLMKSKYAQSDLDKIYCKVEKLLKEKKKVLFSGTPCQIAGLRAFLQKNYSNLLAVEVACHGVPSPKVFRKYIETLQVGNRIEGFDFRDKSTGWQTYSISYRVIGEQTVIREPASDNIFMRGFLSELFLRPSCHTCRFKSLKSGSDILLGDYWGIETVHVDFSDSRGVSLVCVNSDVGRHWLDRIKPGLSVIESDFERAVSHNPCIVSTVAAHPSRATFFARLDKTSDVRCLILSSFRGSLNQRVKQMLYRIVRKLNG